MVEVWLIIGTIASGPSYARGVTPQVEFPTEHTCQISADEAAGRLRDAGWLYVKLYCLPAG